jgi:hypothetical protein
VAVAHLLAVERMLVYLCFLTRPLAVLSLSLQWEQGKLVCLGVALPSVVALVVAPVQVQVALLPGSQVHLTDSQDLPDSTCWLDWLHSLYMYLMFLSKVKL